MAGTKEGGVRASQTNKQRYGDTFYRTIGRLGGETSRGGGFAQGEIGRQRAKLAGHLGGKISRRNHGNNNGN